MRGEPVIRTLERGGLQYEVHDSPQTSSWAFWDLWASGQWEPRTFAALDRYLPAQGLLFDVGAWVGPITLWAAKVKLARVVAFEPDAAAADQLVGNLLLSAALQPFLVDGQVHVTTIAIGEHDGFVPFGIVDAGDSLSSLTRMDVKETVAVETKTLEWAIGEWGRPDVVKMDIEGGESLVLPASGPTLRELGIPLVISLHPAWYAPGAGAAMADELSHWTVDDELGGDAWAMSPKDALR